MLRFHSNDDLLNPEDLHPREVLAEEQRLARSFVMQHPCLGTLDPCPVSRETRTEVLFSKWGQQYALCPKEWNLSLAAMPNVEVVKEYFETSELARYRASESYQRMALRLREGIWRDQVEWLEACIYRHLGTEAVRLTDWGSKFEGWKEALQQSAAVDELRVEAPLPPVSELPIEENQDVICLQDAFQRAVEPRKLLREVSDRLKSGGILLIACRSGSGFDILSLREHSESVYPYDHICLPSPQGLENLLASSGFEILESATPGRLDMPLLRRGTIPPDQLFQRYLMEILPEERDVDMQEFLIKMKLSSHLRIVARKES